MKCVTKIFLENGNRRNGWRKNEERNEKVLNVWRYHVRKRTQRTSMEGYFMRADDDDNYTFATLTVFMASTAIRTMHLAPLFQNSHQVRNVPRPENCIYPNGTTCCRRSLFLNHISCDTMAFTDLFTTHSCRFDSQRDFCFTVTMPLR